MKWVPSVVLVIVVVVLIVLSFPRIPEGHGERGQAESTAYNLKNAISAYFTEYREYPVLGPGSDFTLESDHSLMDIILGSDPEKEPGGRNPRGIAFYTDRAAKPLGDGRFRRGVTLDLQGNGKLWDPWGNHYRVRFDSDFDNQIEDPESPGSFLPESIAVWSAGKDGDFETWKDNVKTW